MLQTKFNIFYYFFVLLYAFGIGAVCTTFYNRLPSSLKMGPEFKPECNSCGSRIKFPYFLPLIGFLLLRGKCLNKKCDLKISSDYPIIETLVPIGIILLALKYKFYTEEFLFGSIFISYCFLAIMFTIREKYINSHFIWFGISSVFALNFHLYPIEIEDAMLHCFIRGIVLIYIDRKRKYFGAISPLFIIFGLIVPPIVNLLFLFCIILLKFVLKSLYHARVIEFRTTIKLLRLFLLLFHYVAIFI